MRRFYLAAALVFVVLAAITTYFTLGVKWVPQADFDVLGILWLMTNLPKLFAWFLTFVFLMLGVASFHKALSPNTRGFSFSARSEEERLLADPRFIATHSRKPAPDANQPDRSDP